jgi:hypothetical protein
MPFEEGGLVEKVFGPIGVVALGSKAFRGGSLVEMVFGFKT